MRDEPTARRMIWAFLGLLIVIGVFWMLTSNRFNPSETSEGVTDVGPQTLAQLTKMGKSGVLEFYTNNCSYCALLAPELVKIDKQYGNRLFVVKMNAEKYPSEAAKYGVQVVPTLVYFDAAGVSKAVVPGFVTSEEIVTTLKGLKLVE